MLIRHVGRALPGTLAAGPYRHARTKNWRCSGVSRPISTIGKGVTVFDP